MSALARNTDPISSYLAGEHMIATGKQAFQQAQAIAAVRAFPGLTSFELAMASGHDRYMLARRLPECARKLNSTICNGEIRACRITNRQAMTWWPTEYQRELIA